MEMLQGDKFPTEITQANLDEFLSKEPKFPKLTKIQDTTPVQDFLSGKNCLTGVRSYIIFRCSTFLLIKNSYSFTGHRMVEI